VRPFGNIGSLFFVVVNDTSSYTGPFCPLQKGQRYDLNMAHWSPNTPNEPGCPGQTECGVFLKSNYSP